MPALPLFLFAAISIVMAVVILIAAQVIGPKRRTAVKEMPYESGMDPVHSARQRFNISFYLLAIEFLVFDVELLFLYPWAVAAHEASPGAWPARLSDSVTARWPGRRWACTLRSSQRR